MILELLGTEISEGRVGPSAVVDVVDEPGKMLGVVVEGFEGHRVDSLDLERCHEALGFGVVVRIDATATASGLLLAALALTGHAAIHEGLFGVMHRLNDALHVLAGGAWLCALIPLLLILNAVDDPLRRRKAGLALRRFSTAGHGAVALVIATGATNTALVLRRWPANWSSPYQALLAGKIVLVLVMTVLALVNRYVFVPRMANKRVASIGALRSGTIVEIGFGMTTIGCVSAFGLLEPA